jgi:hypothetical protein
MKAQLINYALLGLLWSTTASAQSPTYWGVGVNASIPTGSCWNSDNPYAISVMGYGASLEFGQYFGSKIGYNIRVASNGFTHGTPGDPVVVAGRVIDAYSNHVHHVYLS